MKTKLLLTIVIVLVSANLAAQDFAPSQQAQGYLDSKDVSVDYATGLFHYQVPIYTLKSGDFKLPISLNYVGKGVKIDDVPGLVGYNWNLNTGGIVTRTIRGGIADEDYWGNGWLRRGFNNYPTTAQIDSVNRRLIDGECDIFTAALNGEVVNFILKKEGNKIVAEPLERTNIKIECEQTSLYSNIDGWIVTDENGNKYYFRQKEWSTDIVKEDAISFNGVRNKSYVSSWHINKIEPRNCAPILFHYRANVETYSSGANINEVKYYSGYQSIYNYGRPMQNRPFDFSKYRSRFDQEINAARSYLNSFSLEMQLNNSLYIFNGFAGYIRNPFFEINYQNISNNFRVMGQLANLQGLGGASSEVIGILNNLYDTYSNQSSHNARMAASCFLYAKSIMIECLTEVEQMSTQRIGGGSALIMKSPILDRIVCNGKTIKFEYESYSWNNPALKVKSITIEDITKNKIAAISFTIDYNYFLRQLSFTDKNNIEFNKFKFEYHGDSGPYDWTFDIWGFRKKAENDFPDFEFFQNADSDYARIKSLAKIISTDKGEIMIDYESNMIPNKYSPLDMAIETGGIRIKTLVLKDPAKNTADTIKYIYPYPGELVFSDLYNMETVHYSGFSDQIRHSRAKSKGNAFLNTGNCGVYYNYVEEEFVGKGKKTYLFFNPTRFMLPEDLPCKFWFNGLPLGNATYDKNGNLKSITKNKYMIDTESFDHFQYIQDIANVYYAGNWFSTSDNSTKYSKDKWQVKAYEYYMNYQQLKQYYEDQANMFLYNDDYAYYYLNPYYDIFLPNIAPRTNVILPEQRWSLQYGGKVLVKSQEEYRIEDNSIKGPSINHFTTNLGTPINKVEYFYDNIENSIMPTRVSTTDSKGSIHTSVIRRVVDMGLSHKDAISVMKSQNILSPVVKTQSLINNKLLTETVNIYDSLTYDGKTYFGAIQEKIYIPATNPAVSYLQGLDNSLYSYSSSNYSTEKEISYTYHEGKYLPSNIIDRSNTLTLCHDFSLNVPLINVQGYNNDYISAANSYRHSIVHSFNDMLFINALDQFLQAYAYIEWIGQLNYSGQNLTYINGETFQTIKKLIGSIGSGFQNIHYTEFEQYLNYLEANQNCISEFVEFYTRNFPLNEDFFSVLASLELLINNNLTELTYKSLYAYSIAKKTIALTVNQFSGSKLRLYVLSKDYGSSISYTVTRSGGTSTGTTTPTSKTHWNVQVLDIDLSAYSAITSVAINLSPPQNIAYLALLPDDCEFEATSYNSDGTVFCKFDQTGQMERYEYDGAGRVIKIFDGDGKLLKENSYNYILP